MTVEPPGFSWTRIAKEKMVSGQYTVWKSSGWFQLWYGVSDSHHMAKDLGRYCTADEAYEAAERHFRKPR